MAVQAKVTSINETESGVIQVATIHKSVVWSEQKLCSPLKKPKDESYI